MEQFSHLMPEQLHESPFNPRQHYDQAELAELAYSVGQQGIMQPIVVRPIPTGARHQFEVVFGHRRLRAAVLADLVTVPCIVRPMTDEEAAVAQIHENLKRADVNAIDEALGYVRLMHDHGYTTAQLCQKVGRKPGYVYARLKLAKLGKPAQEAVLQGHIGPEIGVLVARYCRNDKLQKKAIDMVTTEERGEDGAPMRRPVPYRQAKQTLRDNFCIRLKVAPFDMADATLRPVVGACTACPKMAGNDAELADATDADACTDRECYDSKLGLHSQRQLSRAVERGLQVLDAEAAAKLLPTRHSTHARGYIDSAQVAFRSDGVDDAGDDIPQVGITFSQALAAMGAAAPKPLVVPHPHRPGVVLELLTEADAARVLVHGHSEEVPMAETWHYQLEDEIAEAREAAGGTAAGSASTPSPAGASARRAEPSAPYIPQWQRELDALPPAARAVRDGATWREISRAIMARVRTTERTAEDLRLLLLRELYMADEWSGTVVDVMGWRDELPADHNPDRDWCEVKLATMGAGEMAALLVVLAIENDGLRGETERQTRLATAERYGVDVLAIAAMQDQKDDAGAAGEVATPAAERDTRTGDLLAGAVA